MRIAHSEEMSLFVSGASTAGWIAFTLLHLLPGITFGMPTFALLEAEFAGDSGNCLGFSAAGIGDVDQDGTPDFIVGAPNACLAIPGFAKAGLACVYSGRTGVLIYRVTVGGPSGGFGSAVGGNGDLNGDGIPDFIVGAPAMTSNGLPGSGSALVYSGASGALLYHLDGAPNYKFGSSIAGLGDIDGDARADFAISSPGSTDAAPLGPGSVFVYSGATGQVLFRIDGPASNETFGASVAAIGDVDGDGKADVLVGAIDAGCDNTFPLNGSAYVVSGATGAITRHITAADACSGFGSSVAGAGDVDGDGVPDVLVGAPNSFFGGSTNAGAMLLYSGATGALLRRSDGLFSSFLGTSVGGGGDVDGDGIRDVLGGAPKDIFVSGSLFSGSAFLYSGASGSILSAVGGNDRYAYLGQTVGNLGDVNGDGRSDYVVGAPGAIEYQGARFFGGVFVFGFVDLVPGRAFTKNPASKVYLGAGNPTCVQIEPVAAAYTNPEVISASVLMRFVGASLRQIKPISVDVVSGTDTDGNGAREISVCFAKTDLRHFFAWLPAGRDTVTVLLEGNLSTGKRFRAPVLLNVVTKAALASTVVPNPVRDAGILTFATTRAGPLRVYLFDVNGKLVRRLTDESSSRPGFHDILIDGRDDRNRALASGIYIYKVESAEGTVAGRVALIR